MIALAVALAVIGGVVVYAITPNPGHNANQIAHGTFEGNLDSVWVFPGKVGIAVGNPLQALHVRDNDAVIFQGTSPNEARSPAISLKEDNTDNHWEIIKRGSSYTGQEDQFVLSYCNYVSNACQWKEPIRLGTNGEIYFLHLKAPAGEKYFICIDDKGKLISQSTPCA